MMAHAGEDEAGPRQVHNVDLGRWYDSIQEAVSDPLALPGQVMLMAEGVYSGPIIISKPLTLVGAGAGRTVLLAPADGLVIAASGTVISGTTIVGAGAGYGITTAHGITNVSIIGNEIRNFDIGVQLNGGAGHVVQGNQILTHTTAGVGLFGDAPDAPITGTRIESNQFAASGIAVWGAFADDNTISDNTMRAGVGGVRLASANNNILDRNTIIDNESNGIYLSQGLPPLIPNSFSNGGNLITGNVILRNQERGIQLLHADSVSGNRIINNEVQVTDEGIFLTTEETQLTVQGNRVSGYEASGVITIFNDGIYIARKSDITVSNNVVSGALGLVGGIVILDSHQVRLTGNTLDGNQTTGLYMAGVTDLAASDNIFRNHAWAAVFLDGPGVLGGQIGGVPAQPNVFRNNGIHITTTLPADNPVIDATFNDWGVTELADIEATIHHAVDDPQLGEIRYFELRQTANPGTIRANGVSRAIITGTLVGLLSPAGHAVAFSTTLGVLGAPGGTTQPDFVTTTLTSTLGGLADVSARAGYQAVTTTIVVLPSVPTTVALQVDPVVVTPGASSRITVTVLDQDGDRVLDDTPVTLATDFGGVSPAVAGTRGGVVTASVGATSMGVAQITATAGPVSGNAFVFFLVDTPMTVTLEVSPTTIVAGETSALTATVKNDAGDDVADGTPVLFVTENGSGPVYQVGIVSGGAASVAVQPTRAGVATVTAICGAAQDAGGIDVSPGPVAHVWVTATPDVIAANGISVSHILVDLRDVYANAVPGALVDLLASPGSVAPAQATSNASGQVTASLTSTTPGMGMVWAVAGALAGGASVVFEQSLPDVANSLAGSLSVFTRTIGVDGVLRKGDTITYTLRVTNTGVALVKDLLVVAPIPTGTEYIDQSASGGVPVGDVTAALTAGALLRPAAVEATAAIVWSGELAPGAAHTLTYAVRTVAVAGAIVNTPEVFARNTRLDVAGLETARLHVEPIGRVYLPVALR